MYSDQRSDIENRKRGGKKLWVHEGTKKAFGGLNYFHMILNTPIPLFSHDVNSLAVNICSYELKTFCLCFL